MPETADLSFPRYLAAKKSVDDRALNHHVWQALVAAAGGLDSGRPRLQALELGAGIGTMVERIVTWGLTRNAEYTAVDALAENLVVAQARLSAWARRQEASVTVAASGTGLDLEIGGTPADDHLALSLRLRAADLFDFVADVEQQGRYDLLIAHAVLDLLDLPTALPAMVATLRPGGLCYFTINFDGVTTFQPEIDPVLDARIVRLYHRSMDERRVGGRPSGDSQTGRHLFPALGRAGVEVLAAGGSDWVVHPVTGVYPADEAYFLRHILHFVETTLHGHDDLDPAAFDGWLERRHHQLETGELVYIAHQIDLLGRVSP